ncbi:hypothetical protein [uncultured Paludibaculum sp.]|uniref:hypothetical protein n=1 Tax=uncultured Paludibaculum sp. TaxID=1765020 RepID=UPI002AAB3836|nr:hypothetical protein [uncultured Paludibaculum sp.]
MRRLVYLLGSIIMAMPGADAAVFSLEYAQHSGYGRMPTRILVDGTKATLIRQETLKAGEPIGVFQAAITQADQKRLAAAVPDSIDAGAPPMRDSEYFIVRLKTDNRNADLRFAHDPAALEKAGAMMKELTRLETGLAWKPARAVVLELTPNYAVNIRNIGTESVRLPFGTLGLTIESIAAAEPPKVPGMTPRPRVWEMANGTANLPKSVELAAGQSLEFALPLGATTADKMYRARFYARGNIDPAQPDLFGTAYSVAVAGGRK